MQRGQRLKHHSIRLQPGTAWHSATYGRRVVSFSSSRGFARRCAPAVFALDFVFFQSLSLAEYQNFFQQNRELSILILGINWAIAMGVWMAIRKHPLRHNLEMSSRRARDGQAIRP